MFEDDYKEVNESIKPDKTVLDEIRRKNRRQKKKKNPYAIISIAASLIFVFAFSFLLLKLPFTNNTEYVKSSSYNDIYKLAKKIKREENYDAFFDFFTLAGASKDTSLPGEMAMPDSLPENDNFSDTNVQVEGVMEADVIKTDGKYIYTLYKGNIYIVEVDGKDMKEVGKIQIFEELQQNMEKDRDERDEREGSELPIDSTFNPHEFYITKDRIIVIASDSSYYWRINYTAKTRVLIYDKTDIENPVLLNTLGQSGYYVSSRMVDNNLYIISTYNVYSGEVTKEPDTFVPMLYNEEGKDMLVGSQDIYLVPNPSSLTYSVICSIDVNKPDSHKDTKTLLGGNGNVYASTENIYVTHYSYMSNEEKTHIVRLSIDEGHIEVAATGKVPGSILNQFSMDEYNDHFRICTTNQGNNLYVLDMDLKVLGKIEGLAKGERIFSVRFYGDIGYFVTFLQVDPLYTVDLSDPKNPTLLSELKIPGFSRYLHKYADDLLFGIGNDADENTGVQQELKLSMFDVSDKGQVYEKDVYIFKHEAYYSDALFNHKAILISPNRNIIAFFAEGTYYVFSYDREEGFMREASLAMPDTYIDHNSIRGLYIGDYLFVSYQNMISSYSLSDFALASDISLS